MSITDDLQISRDPLGLVDYGDTDNEELLGEENLENGNILVNIMNNNVEELGNHNKNVAMPITFRRSDLARSPEEHTRRMSASSFFISGEEDSSNGSGSSEHECETSCELSTNDDEDIDGGQADASPSLSFTPIHWLRPASNGIKDEKKLCQGLDIFDDNANDGCDEDDIYDQEPKTAPKVDEEQANDFLSFSKSKRPRLRNKEAQEDFDLRTVLGNRGSKESVPVDFNVVHGVPLTAEETDHKKDMEDLRRKIQTDIEHLKELAQEREENRMNLENTARKKMELEEQIVKLSQKNKFFEEKRIEIEGNIDFTEHESKKDKKALLRMMMAHEKAIRETDHEDINAEADNPSVSVTVINSLFDEPRRIPLVESVRDVNFDQRASTSHGFGPIYSQNVNVNVITKPTHSGWKKMEENCFVHDGSPDFFAYINKNWINVHEKEKYKCRLCDISVTTKKTLWSHLQGKKHVANMRRKGSYDPKNESGDEKIIKDRKLYEEEEKPSTFSSDLRNLLKRKRESSDNFN